MSRFYFLKEDLKALDTKIDKLRASFEQLGRDMGESTTQSSETFHDNFPFEEALRQFQMTNRRLAELMRIRQQAYLADLIPTDRVSVGKHVTVRDANNGEEKTYRIGSYRVFSNDGSVSYIAPLAKILIGARAGDVRQGMIAGKPKTFIVIRVE